MRGSTLALKLRADFIRSVMEGSNDLIFLILLKKFYLQFRMYLSSGVDDGFMVRPNHA